LGSAEKGENNCAINNGKIIQFGEHFSEIRNIVTNVKLSAAASPAFLIMCRVR